MKALLLSSTVLASVACVLPAKVDPAAAYCSPESPSSCIRISLSRVYVPFLQDYARRLELLAGPRTLAGQDLVPHHHNWLRMNLYSRGSGRIIMREGQWGESIWDLDLQHGTIILLDELPSSGPPAVYVGAFDLDNERRFRFIPVTERPERALPEFER
jgi:hypothetical protein